MKTVYSPSHSSSRGFTLVELLVVIAIIGILVALLLPAVQAAREAARRMQCTNNMKQIGIAMHNYHDSNKRFPAGYLFLGGKRGNTPAYGWAVSILPYMEMSALYDELDPGKIPLSSRYTSGASAADKALLQTRIDAYRCPSDVLGDLNDVQSFGPNHFQIATSNYIGCCGYGDKPWVEDVNPDPDVPAKTGGMFAANSWIGMHGVTDGTTNTMMISERDGGPTGPHPTTGAYTTFKGAFWAGAGRNDTFDPNGPLATLFRAGFNVNRDYNMEGAPQNMGKGFSSLHPGGTNIGMVDGSVHFLSETVDGNNVVRPMSLRNDGEVFQSPF